MTIKLFLLTGVLLFNFCKCGTKNSNATDQAYGHAVQDKSFVLYNLSKPSQVWNLPESLKEVSGIGWVDSNHCLFIEDLHPDLYLVRLEKQGIIEKKIVFAQQSDRKFDVEDVAIAGNKAYALWSHGAIYQIDNWNSKPTVRRWETGLSKANDTEGLCFDPVSNDLLIACKNESSDEGQKKSTRAVYRFDLSSGKLKENPFLLVYKKDLKQKESEVSNFYPSAIAIHPQTHDLYILSTKETKAMAVYSYDGKLKSFQFIDKELMPQPEGLCFSPEGDLYISTEGKHGKQPKVLKFQPLKIIRESKRNA